MPKYLVSITCTETYLDKPDPNLATCKIVITNTRRRAVRHVAELYHARHIAPLNEGHDMGATVAQILEAFDDVVEHDIGVEGDTDEWSPLFFLDCDSIMQVYAVRITSNVYVGADVTA